VVVCTPIGYEAQFAFVALRDLAIALTERTGATVLRFDYDGCGDSAGTDEDGERVPRWLASVHAAIDELVRLAPSDGPLILVGLRMGALLAATVAATRKDVTGVALWAPCHSGRLFLRELRAFSGMAFASATAAGAEKERWGEHGFEANGYVFTDDTVAGLETLDLKSIAAPAPRLLVLDRSDITSRRTLPEHWRAPGAESAIQIDQRTVPGYAEMIMPPWLSKVPTEAIGAICAWVDTQRGAAPVNELPSLPAEVAATIAEGVEERALFYDAAQERFAVLTTPASAPATHVVVLITSTFGYRVGPNRMNVPAARRLARQGIATLRIDQDGAGESRHPNGKLPRIPYDLAAADDVRMAVQLLVRRGYREVALSGLCAGAFHAWYAADRSGDAVTRALLVNPGSFVPLPNYLETSYIPVEGLPLWRHRLSQEKRLFGKAKILAQRGIYIAGVGEKYARTLFPLLLQQDSPVTQLGRMGARGARLSIIFSTGDESVKRLRMALGFRRESFLRKGWLSTAYIDGPDHNFTPRWANRALLDAMERDLIAWYRGAASRARPA
jgi:alpha-beta hydrolase superfamily lysophospholipase